MADPFLGEIRIFPFNFAPSGWAFCNGQLLNISQNTALFSILGTTYGGNGSTTFGLPNLQNSTPLSSGQGPGLSARALGAVGGQAVVTLKQSEMPTHPHTVSAAASGSGASSPQGNVWAPTTGTSTYHSGAPNVAMSSQALGVAGQSLPHTNMPPYLVLNFCIALQGVFPSRT